MTGQEQCGFCPLPSHRLSHMGGGTHKSLVNTGGLNCSLGTDPGSVGKPGCSPGSWDQTALGGLLSARESVSEGSK